MKLDYDVIRWRFLIIAFLCLFFLIGGTRYVINKVKEYPDREPVEVRHSAPSASLTSQVLDAQRRAQHK